MNILFLDDNEERIKITRNYLPNSVFVKTAEQCIEALKKENKWKIVMLDYDLDEDQDKEVTGCGMDVVQWMCENKQNIETVLVHSRNFFGSNEMVKNLLQNGYVILQIPFFDIKWNYLSDFIRD